MSRRDSKVESQRQCKKEGGRKSGKDGKNHKLLEPFRGQRLTMRQLIIVPHRAAGQMCLWELITCRMAMSRTVESLHFRGAAVNKRNIREVTG